ncbi:hypothetical protein AAVH_35909, partial [Aphelenchoides avenae]
NREATVGNLVVKPVALRVVILVGQVEKVVLRMDLVPSEWTAIQSQVVTEESLEESRGGEGGEGGCPDGGDGGEGGPDGGDGGPPNGLVKSLQLQETQTIPLELKASPNPEVMALQAVEVVPVALPVLTVGTEVHPVDSGSSESKAIRSPTTAETAVKVVKEASLRKGSESMGALMHRTLLYARLVQLLLNQFLNA